MSYELRPPSEFALIDPESERQSNGDPDRSRLLLEFNNALVSHLDLESLLKAIFEQIKQVFLSVVAFFTNILKSTRHGFWNAYSYLPSPWGVYNTVSKPVHQFFSYVNVIIIDLLHSASNWGKNLTVA